MEFAWHIQKNKISDVKPLDMEQERKGKIKNPDIDSSRTKLNYDFVIDEKTLYQRIKNRVESVRSVSRIQKNSVVSCSNVVTLSKDISEEWGKEKSDKFFEEVYNYFCSEFGKENVVSAKVHLDETAPHMHLHFVPISKGGKLQASKVVDRNKINEIHNTAPAYLREKGFDVVRGAGVTRESLEIHKYKKEKLQENIKELEYDFEVLQSVTKDIKELDKIKGKKSILGKVSLDSSEFESLKQLAEQTILLQKEMKDLQRENVKNKNELKKYNELYIEKSKLANDLNKKLKENEKKLSTSENNYKQMLEFINKEGFMNRYIDYLKQESEEKRKTVNIKTEKRKFINDILINR